MQLLEVSGAVRPIYGSLGVKRLIVLCVTFFLLLIYKRLFATNTENPCVFPKDTDLCHKMSLGVKGLKLGYSSRSRRCGK